MRHHLRKLFAKFCQFKHQFLNFAFIFCEKQLKLLSSIEKIREIKKRLFFLKTFQRHAYGRN